MRDYESHQPAGRLARHRLLACMLAVLVLGGAGFALAGGVDVIRGWLTVTTEINGEVISVQDVELDENGTATFDLPLPPGDEPTDISLTIDAGEVTGAEEGDQAVINISADGEVAEIQLQLEPAEEDDDEGTAE